MDRHAMIRVLADPSRHAVYEDLVGGSRPATIGDIAERLDLHPSTVRLHLEKLRDAGLVDSEPDRHGSVGRPHLMWTARWPAPALGLEPGGMRMLAHLLADLAALDPAAPGRAGAVGRRRAGEIAAGDGYADAPAGRPAGRAPVGAGAGAGDGDGPGGPGPSGVGGALEQLARLGFDPSVEASVDGQVISFAGCPFREVAVLYPDLVCQLHRGITAALVERAGASLLGFSTLVDPDPCRAEVSLNA